MQTALPDIRDVMRKFLPTLSRCPLASKVFPDGSIFPAYRKLPSLSTHLLKNPFSPPIPTKPHGFFPSDGCSCKVFTPPHVFQEGVSLLTSTSPAKMFGLSMHSDASSAVCSTLARLTNQSQDGAIIRATSGVAGKPATWPPTALGSTVTPWWVRGCSKTLMWLRSTWSSPSWTEPVTRHLPHCQG